ncbi:tumor necrosis factor ligand superfamily member 13 isoform X2 [Nycticebus coucang]|uniref:tumor necrosis factor ligand superfamily member 13 isoform X2 n=1 Tax=Nycticebus coucang TaxID=9470 RepID=UPI00234DF380|nr:tumor necrosis factor ligand superfamily member 13 isoform X2 [Nycticebus coucang]
MPASSHFLLAPKGPSGDMGAPVREPALSVALWLSWGAALGAVACAIALLTQQTELQSLRREVSRLQRSGGPSQKGEGYSWQSLQKQSPDALEAWENGERSRRKRAVLTQKQKKKRSVLHLAPINFTSKEDSDVTEVMWQPALKRGRGLEAKGYVVRVWDAGVYLLYSQVVSREGPGQRETLLRCVRSMPSNPDRAYNSCYSAGVFHLHQGDILSVIIPRARAKLSLSPHGTFLGFVKL